MNMATVFNKVHPPNFQMWVLLVLPLVSPSSILRLIPNDFTLVPEENELVKVSIEPPLSGKVTVFLNDSSWLSVPSSVPLDGGGGSFNVTGRVVIAETFVEVFDCQVDDQTECPLDLSQGYARVVVLSSHGLDVVVVVVGWLYFVAWSISFWPQIYLNFRRKSVIGLNFDFVTLNTVGFASYTIYNCLIYFDVHVQNAYKLEHPRGPIPVLLNDVVFAAHAFLACVITGVQAIAYERGSQRVSIPCLALAVVLVVFGVVSAILSWVGVLALLRFVDFLSYIKMVVTLCKYFPQAYFNYQRKSTIGWSIGNILLDFTGGTLDLLQVALQAVNVHNFSAFIGNPVKFGLGLVSIIFDVFFMIQHYVLYREIPSEQYEGIENQNGPQNLDTGSVRVGEE